MIAVYVCALTFKLHSYRASCTYQCRLIPLAVEITCLHECPLRNDPSSYSVNGGQSTVRYYTGIQWVTVDG